MKDNKESPAQEDKACNVTRFWKEGQQVERERERENAADFELFFLFLETRKWKKKKKKKNQFPIRAKSKERKTNTKWQKKEKKNKTKNYEFCCLFKKSFEILSFNLFIHNLKATFEVKHSLKFWIKVKMDDDDVKQYIVVFDSQFLLCLNFCKHSNGFLVFF